MAHYRTLLASALFFALASGAARADGNIGLRLSIPLFSLAKAGQSVGIHVPAPRAAYGELRLPQRYAAGPATGDDTPPLLGFAPGVSFYYGWSQGDDSRRNPSLYQLVPPSASDARTMGLQFAYPF